MSETSGKESGKDRITQLEEEGEIAADYLEELLDIADLDGDIEIDVENGRASVAVLADDTNSLTNLVGENGEVLDALQELTRLAVQTETGERSRLMLDVAGFRQERREELQVLTLEAIARLRLTGRAQHLDPMNPFERKVCHDVVAKAGLVSESEGMDPHRHVVILALTDANEAVSGSPEAPEAPVAPEEELLEETTEDQDSQE